MNNRISGDFGMDALEAFRAAYAQREVKPEDLEVDNYTGLPTGEVTNISPWIQHTGLWRANPGTDRGFVPNQVLELEDDTDDGEISEEEFDRMVDEVLSDLEEEERFADRIYDSDDEDEEEEELEDMGDEELEALIDSLLAESDEDAIEEPEEEEAVEVPSEEEIDSLIEEIMAEIEEEEAAEEEEASRNRELTNDELEGMIDDLSQEVEEDDIDRIIDEVLGGSADGDDEVDDTEPEEFKESDDTE